MSTTSSPTRPLNTIFTLFALITLFVIGIFDWVDRTQVMKAAARPSKPTPPEEPKALAVAPTPRPPEAAAPTPRPPEAAECRWAIEPPKIDGDLSDPVWKDAAIIDHFTVPWLGKDARPARTSTRARLLWDREYLYFAADMEDTDLYALVREHDGPTWNDDVFELFFKPAKDKGGYYEFQVNAAGTTMDMFLPRRGAGSYQRFKDDMPFHLEAKVKLKGTLNQWTDHDTGWTVEGRVPWRDFLKTGGRPSPGEEWSFALCRYDYSVDFEGPELSTTAPLTRPDFHRHEDYAPLRFVGPKSISDSSRGGIDAFIPVDTSRVMGSPEPPPPYRVVKAFPRLKNVPHPIGVAREPGTDRLFLIHQARPWGGAGAISTIKDDPNVTTAEPFLDPDGIAYGIAFHPDYTKNRFMYVGYNGPFSSKPKVSRVVRYTIDRNPPYGIVEGSRTVIIEWESDGHNGADLGFGKDGMLYVTSGDGTSDSDTNLAGQDLTKLLAKVLRIDVDHPDPGKHYSVPKDNPFVGRQGTVPETWAYGFRNPWRIHCDRETGDIWVGNNGQDLWEQVYLVEKGANYGWSVVEGTHPFYANRKAGPEPFSKPIADHPHSEARSLTGGVVYRGQKFPELRGAYLYGDFSTGKVWGIRHDKGKVTWHKELVSSTMQVTGFGYDSRGEILIADLSGGYFTLEPNPAADTSAKFPRKLSETGLFASVAGHKPGPGLIPYSVNAPLWSDGAHKERFLALPKDTQFDYSANRGWNLPEGTVAVKSFALDMPKGRKWIETRLLLKHQGQWAGYSYAWNDEQTEATLVESAGKDQTFRVAGDKSQTWRYPSRAECMTCHSRAANFVLGLCELQFNKEHDYGNGRKANQLLTLERLALLKVNYSGEWNHALRVEGEAKGLKDKALSDYVAAVTATRNQRGPAPSPSPFLRANPESIPHLVDPYDPKQPLDLRARSYLHSNCATCHVEAGGGNAQINLEFTTAIEKMKLFDQPPLHHTFGVMDPKLIASGAPDRSVLLKRVGKRGEGQMPPLATAVVDQAALEMLTEWVKQLPTKPAATAGR